MRSQPLPPAPACFHDGNDFLNGRYIFPRPSGPTAAGPICVIASDGSDWEDVAGFALPAWEHVSVSLPDRCPTWAEMCWIKSLFWRDDEAVIQLHPTRATYVNYHPYCLHLWKPIAVDLILPPAEAVGPLSKGSNV